jgi:hypothetical protein
MKETGRPGDSSRKICAGVHFCLDRDDFGLNPSKIMNVINCESLERDTGEKPVPTFPHPAIDEHRQTARGWRALFAQSSDLSSR